MATCLFTGVDLHAAMHREAAIYTLKRSSHNDHAAIHLIESGKIDAEKLVSHRFPLVRADCAFSTIADYADGVAKAVVEVC